MSLPIALYLPRINSTIAHWQLVAAAIVPKTLVIRVPDTDTSLSLADFIGLRNRLQTQLATVQSCLAEQQLAISDIRIRKASLLELFNLFTSLMDGCFRNTRFYDLRPLAPSIGDGQLAFSKPMFDMMAAWDQINKGPAPAGVSLPLLLGNGVTQSSFASQVSALQFDYVAEHPKEALVTLARSDRNIMQATAYAVMKTYREVLPGTIPQFPSLIETMPRLTPLPGHTPEPVNASVVFEAPNASKVVHDASPDAMLHSYQLRGCVGDHYDEEDAIVIDTHGPNDPREFITTFGLNQPGAQVSFKLFVILTTDNEAGSAPLTVERPVSLSQAA